MIEFTTGDVRFINEVTNGWRMAIDEVLYEKGEPSKELLDRIDSLRKEYQDAFEDYFINARKSGEYGDNDQIKAAFDEEFKKDHPEYYDTALLV